MVTKKAKSVPVRHAKKQKKKLPATKKKAAPARKAKQKSKGNGAVDATIEFHYLKGNQFRAIHVDGAIGGVTPNGNIHMALFSERSAIPRKVEMNVNKNGTLGDERSRSGLSGVVRDMEVDVILSEPIARNIREWLDSNISKLDERNRLLAEARQKPGKETKKKAKQKARHK